MGRSARSNALRVARYSRKVDFFSGLLASRSTATSNAVGTATPDVRVMQDGDVAVRFNV
jgi:hypothetical protein